MAEYLISWLENKLSTTSANDTASLWTAYQLAPHLTADKLNEIDTHFGAVHQELKVKVLLALLHMPPRLFSENSALVERLLQRCSTDFDPWVHQLSKLLSTVQASKRRKDDISFIMRQVNEETGASGSQKSASPNVIFPTWPLNSCVLSKSLVKTTRNDQTKKYFRLKRKPKSAALRADLLEKAADSKNLKSTVPVRMRSFAKSLTDLTTTTVNGKQDTSGMFTGGFRAERQHHHQQSGTGNYERQQAKGDTALKIIELNELPPMGREAKRRQKMKETEERRLMKEHEQAEKRLRVEQEQAALSRLGYDGPIEKAPSYLSGLIDQQAADLQPPSYAPAFPGAAAVSSDESGWTSAVPSHSPSGTTSAVPVGSSSHRPTTSTTAVGRPHVVGAAQQSQLKPSPGPSPSSAGLYSVMSAHSPDDVSPSSVDISPSPDTLAHGLPTPPGVGPTSVQKDLASPAVQSASQTAPVYKLSREQLLAAQDLFKQSPLLTQEYKSLILGFIAGYRDHEISKRARIVQIKASEKLENSFGGQSQLVSRFVVLNYDTGNYSVMDERKPVTVLNPVAQRPPAS